MLAKEKGAISVFARYEFFCVVLGRLPITVAVPELGRGVVGLPVGGGQVEPERRRSGAGKRLVTRLGRFLRSGEAIKGAPSGFLVFCFFNQVMVAMNRKLGCFAA